MGIGAGIFLLAVGGVLAFAVTDRISGVDLTMVGYILMGAGALGIALVLLLNGQRTRASQTTVVEERRDLRDPRDPRI
jgi:nitrate/nitrite transporter NarK